MSSIDTGELIATAEADDQNLQPANQPQVPGAPPRPTYQAPNDNPTAPPPQRVPPQLTNPPPAPQAPADPQPLTTRPQPSREPAFASLCEGWLDIQHTRHRLTNGESFDLLDAMELLEDYRDCFDSRELTKEVERDWVMLAGLQVMVGLAIGLGGLK